MQNNCYTYYKVDEDSYTSYLFSTNFEKIYTVYFDAQAYVKYLDKFPFLLQNSYGFGFKPTNFTDQEKKSFDSMVFPTIIDILDDFWSTGDENTVILYHCDASDFKQQCRDKLFNKWYNKYHLLNGLVEVDKHNLTVEIKRDIGDPVYYFIGMLIKKNNPNLQNAIHELNAFSLDLVNENLNK